MREDRRRRYDDGFRREALELIKSGAGKATLVRRLAIPVYTARNWIGLYRSNGEEAVMGGGGSRRYDWETKVAGSKAYLAPVYDMASKEIVAWDVSRSPDLGQQKRLPAMLAERLPAGAEPILHSDMGDGSTSTNGGGRSSNASAFASPWTARATAWTTRRPSRSSAT